MDLRPLAPVAVLAIHILLISVGTRRLGSSREHRTFLAFAGVVAAWALGRILFLVGEEGAGRPIVHLAALATPLLLPRLARRTRELARSAGGAAALAALALAAVAIFLRLGATPPEPATGLFSWSPGVGPLLSMAIAAFLVAPVVMLHHGIPWPRAEMSQLGRLQSRAAGIVLVVGGAWIALGTLFGLPRPRPDVVSVLAAEAAVLEAIRTRKIDLEPASGTGLVRVVQAFATAAIVLIGLTVANRLLRVEAAPLQVVLLMASAFAATWVVGASAARLERWVEGSLYPERARYRRLSEEIAREREDLRRRLAQRERLALIGEVAGSVAHEIKNPLGPIKGFAQMIAEDLDRTDRPLDREVLKRRVDVIVEEVERIDERVRGLLTQARVSAEVPSACDVNEMVERALLLVEGEAARRVGVELTAELRRGEGLPRLTLRRQDVEAALVNLLLNAIDAIDGARGHIEVTTSRLDDADAHGVEIRIRDDGRGIPAEVLPSIFDPFVSGRDGGVGLGLGIARRAVEADGGSLGITSRVGEGTEIRIVLPLPPGEEAR